MIKRLYVVLVLLMMSIQCKTKKNIEQMRNKMITISKEIVNNMEEFDKTPNYALQVNKNKCKVLIRVNDIPYSITFVKDKGASHLCYLNAEILKSGKQEVVVEVFPMEGDTYIDEGASVDLTLSFSPDKDTSLHDFQQLAQLSLPEEVRGEKVPYYKFVIPFKAEVPWDCSKPLEEAQDLKDMPNIEQKVIAKYEYLMDLVENLEGSTYAKEMQNKLKKSQYYYFSKQDLLDFVEKSEDDPDFQIFGKEGSNPKGNPITDYELVFGYGGKLVVLRQRKDKDHLFRYTIFIDEEDETEYWENMLLYMPKGSDKFVVY